MSKAKGNFRTAINFWIVPFFIGGSLAIGYEMTHKVLISTENKSRLTQTSVKKQIILRAKDNSN